MKKLLLLLNEMEQHSMHYDKVHTSTSHAIVGWHIQHSLLVITQIVTRLKKSDPEVYKWKFNLARTFVYLSGRIPRGKGKAPETVIPQGEINSIQISAGVLEARKLIDEISALHPNNYIKHPYFGDLNVKQVKTFLLLHTHHHLKIIKDILKQ